VKLLEGYVKNRTLEFTLAAMFGALVLISRQIALPIFIPPLKGLDPSGIFYSSMLLVLSYPYIWLFSGILAFTSVMPLPAFPCWAIGFHIFYFLSRLIGLRWARYFSFFSSPINGIVTLIIFGWLKIFPFNVFFIPVMTKTLSQGVLAFMLVPLIIKLLEKFGVITYE